MLLPKSVAYPFVDQFMPPKWVECKYLNPEEIKTMSNMMLNVALSPVAMLMMARMVRRRLKGLNVAR